MSRAVLVVIPAKKGATTDIMLESDQIRVSRSKDGAFLVLIALKLFACTISPMVVVAVNDINVSQFSNARAQGSFPWSIKKNMIAIKIIV
ncbi:hypothetical protein C9993_04675 [Marinobacter sp. Z-F4-2]|nr:hypothetical protein C9993_04675 [Marinobacter sp. Z-F4-2]